MKRGIIIAAVCVTAAAVAGGVWIYGEASAGQTGLLPYQDVEVTQRGEVLYAEFCAACHGADLAGEPDWQVRGDDGLAPAPPHDRTGHTWHHPDAMLIAMTRDGVAAVVGRGYESAMMGFSDVMSEDEIIATLAYIKSTWPDDVIEIHNEINAAAAE